MDSLAAATDPVNSFEARRQYLEGNVKAAEAAMSRAHALLKELGDAYWVARELYEAHLGAVTWLASGEVALTQEQAAQKYRHDKAVQAANEAANDVACAVKMAREAVTFAERLKAEADAARTEVYANR